MLEPLVALDFRLKAGIALSIDPELHSHLQACCRDYFRMEEQAQWKFKRIVAKPE
jgi:hypothetical protein